MKGIKGWIKGVSVITEYDNLMSNPYDYSIEVFKSNNAARRDWLFGTADKSIAKDISEAWQDYIDSITL